MMLTVLATLVVVGCDSAKKSPADPLAGGTSQSAESSVDSQESAPPSLDAAKPSKSQTAKLDSGELAIAEKLKSAGATVGLRGDDKIASVEFRDAPMTDSLAEAVAGLAALTKLAIYEADMTDVGWASLGACSNLEHFDVRNCSISNSQLLASASGMPKLRSLRLSGGSGKTKVDDAGLEVLSKLPGLKVLAADELWVSEAGLSQLATPTELTELYVAKTLVEDEGLQVIASMSNLKKLRLANNNVTAEGLAAISSLPLEELDLSECLQFGDPAMAHIAKLKSLKKLNLWRTAITDAGVAKLSGLTNLLWLNLDNTPLTDSGLDALESLQDLEFLHLGSTQVTDQGMAKLANLKSLKKLIVSRTAVTEDGLQALQEALPDADLQTEYDGE